jgi:hypothetical protein
MAAKESAGLCEGRFWGTIDKNRGRTLGERSTTDVARRQAARTNIGGDDTWDMALEKVWRVVENGLHYSEAAEGADERPEV